jgi:hypothetical protein
VRGIENTAGSIDRTVKNISITLWLSEFASALGDDDVYEFLVVQNDCERVLASTVEVSHVSKRGEIHVSKRGEMLR